MKLLNAALHQWNKMDSHNWNCFSFVHSYEGCDTISSKVSFSFKMFSHLKNTYTLYIGLKLK